MAKKKADASAAASKPAKKSSSSSSSHAKSASATPTTGGTARQIDTSVAANVAAAMIAGKVAPSSSANASSAPKKESAAFKQLKAGLNKPSAGALGGVFGNVNQQKKSHLPHGGGKQVGHNQTFGSDAARTGVPRRTPG